MSDYLWQILANLQYLIELGKNMSDYLSEVKLRVFITLSII